MDIYIESTVRIYCQMVEFLKSYIKIMMSSVRNIFVKTDM